MKTPWCKNCFSKGQYTECKVGYYTPNGAWYEAGDPHAWEAYDGMTVYVRARKCECDNDIETVELKFEDFNELLQARKIVVEAATILGQYRLYAKRSAKTLRSLTKILGNSKR